MECQSYVFYIISPYNSSKQNILAIENLDRRDMEGNRDISRKKIHISFICSNYLIIVYFCFNVIPI